MEAKVLKLQEELDHLQHQVKSLEGENLTLYSKIKFLQMYTSKKLHQHDVYVSGLRCFVERFQ